MELPQLLSRVKQWRRGRAEGEVIRFVEELFHDYLGCGDDDRRSVRQVVRENRHLWDVAGEDDICLYLAHVASDTTGSAVPHLRGWLTAVSLTGGCGDWRDTVVVLDKLRREVEAQGTATRADFEQIAATADTGDTHGISGMSTRDLLLSAGGLCWHEGEVLEKTELLRRLGVPPNESSGSHAPSPRESPRVSRTERPWWRFWG